MLGLYRMCRKVASWGDGVSRKLIERFPGVMPVEWEWLAPHLHVTAESWLSFQWVLGLVLGVLVGVIVESATWAVAAAALGWGLPRWWVKEETARRQREVMRGLPNLLDLLTACVEAGLTFDAGIAKVVEFSAPSLLQQECAQYLYEVRVGQPRREAMKAMARRVNLPPFSTFLASVAQAEQLGTSLAEGLRIQAREIRVKWRQAMERQALEAPVKLLFPLTVFIFPTTFLIIFGPLLLRFLKEGY